MITQLHMSNSFFELSKTNPAKVEVSTAPEELPEEFQTVKTTVSADKKKLKAHLESGGEVKGVEITHGHRVVFK